MIESLLLDTARRSARYLDGLEQRAVAPSPEAIEALRTLADAPLPQHGLPAERVLATLDDVGSPATLASAGGRFFGLVIGGSLPAALAANWLASAWDQNAAYASTSPVAAALEETALRWLLELFALPRECGGAFVTGATLANFTALAAARHALLAREGWDVEAEGLFGAPELRVVVGEEVHPSVLKALGLLGLGRDRVVRVPADEQGRMLANALPPLDARTIVCAQAGNVNSGASDPFAALALRTRECGAWLHVDGAFGLFARACPATASQALGVECADSWAVDFHKWLNVPYDSAAAFVRDARSLEAAMALGRAAYLVEGAGRSPCRFTPELSRRARGVDVWAALQSLGRDGVAALVERCCRHARTFAEGLHAAGFEVLNTVSLNQVVVDLGSSERAERVVRALQADGRCWCGPTRWKNRHALRISISSWRTTDVDVERSLAAIVEVASEG
jgi:glutamate/tyrosine decarboxylase-like PLP-dependent enzyme